MKFTFVAVGFHKFVAKDTLKAFDDFKNKQQKSMKRCFLIYKRLFWKFIQYTISWDKTIKIYFVQNKRYKKALFFLSRAPSQHSFTFNSQFLYELKHMVYFSKTVCGIFHFRFRLVLIILCIFVQQKGWL